MAKCLPNLHCTQRDTCISTQGSGCDSDGYVAGGGKVLNTGLDVAASVHASDVNLTATQSWAAQAVFGSLVGTSLPLTGAAPQLTFFTAADTEDGEWPAYQINMNGVSTTHC